MHLLPKTVQITQHHTSGFRILKPSHEGGWSSVLTSLCLTLLICVQGSLACQPTLNLSECVTLSKTHHAVFWEDHVPFSFSSFFSFLRPCNSTSPLSCHSLICLSPLPPSFIFLFSFHPQGPMYCDEPEVGMHGVVLQRLRVQRSKPEDEQMWHSPILL